MEHIIEILNQQKSIERLRYASDVYVLARHKLVAPPSSISLAPRLHAHRPRLPQNSQATQSLSTLAFVQTGFALSFYYHPIEIRLVWPPNLCPLAVTSSDAIAPPSHAFWLV